MSHTFAKLSQFIEDYRYYRRKGFYHRAAWYLARMKYPA